MALPVSALYTGLFLLLMLALAINVVRLRMSEGVSMGDGDNNKLRAAVRSHGNAAEYVPLVLIGMAMLEGLGVSASLLFLYGGVFFLGRILHVLGLAAERSVNKMRQMGIVLSWLTMLVMAIHLLITALNTL